MKKVLLYVVVSFFVLGCASKDISLGNVSKSNSSPYIKNILKEYLQVKKNPVYSKKAPLQLYKATKIARALTSEQNPTLKNHYAYLLKNQVRIVKLTKQNLI